MNKYKKLHCDYSECRIEYVKSIQDSTLPVLRYFTRAENEDDFEQYSDFLRDYKRLKSPHLSELKKMELSKIKKHCSVNYIIDTTWEFSVHTLETELEYRKLTGQKFTDNEIGTIYHTGLQAIADLHKAELQHGCLRPTNILFMHKSETTVKLLPNMRGITSPFISAQRLIQAQKLPLYVSQEIRNLLTTSRGPRGEGKYPRGDFEALIDIIESLPKDKHPIWLDGVKTEIKKSQPVDWYLGNRLLKRYQGELPAQNLDQKTEFIKHIDISSRDYLPPADSHQTSSIANPSSKLIFTDVKDDIPESAYKFQRDDLANHDALKRPRPAGPGITPFNLKLSHRDEYPQSSVYASSKQTSSVAYSSSEKISRSQYSHRQTYANKNKVIVKKHEGLFELDLTKEVDDELNYNRMPMSTVSIDARVEQIMKKPVAKDRDTHNMRKSSILERRGSPIVRYIDT